MNVRATVFAFVLFSGLLGAKEYARPALIDLETLTEYSGLSKERQEMLKTAMEAAKKTRSKKYKYGGSSPEAGGFDCSGAMYYVMTQSGVKPPRTSAQQYLWVRDAGNLVEVSKEVRKLDAPVFKDLKPGDLLFWTGTYEPTDGRKVKITHVGMYLGTEKKDGRPVMINATTGRSYRGVAADGFGVYDFRIPSLKSKSRFVGYGSPPGLKAKPAE